MKCLFNHMLICIPSLQRITTSLWKLA